MLRLFACAMMISLTALSARVVIAQSLDKDPPMKMLGFVKPGMHLGVHNSVNRSGDAEAFFSLTIFENDGFQIAADTRELSIDELRAKYPAVDKYAEMTLSQFEKSIEERSKELESGKRYAQPSLSMSANRRMEFCTVIHVGDDYILVSRDESDERKQALPKHMIKKIDWSDGIPRLYPQSRVVDIGADETKLHNDSTPGTP